MKKLLALFLFALFNIASAETRSGDVLVAPIIVNPQITGGSASGITGVSDNGILVNSTGTTATLRNLWKDLSSSGWIEGFDITDAGGETVNVAAGEFVIRSGATETSPLYYENGVAGLTGVAIPTNTTRYLIGSWNSGTPNISFSATDTSNGYQLVYLGEVHNVAGTLIIHSDPRPAGDAVNRIQNWAVAVIGDRISSGNVTYDPSAPSRKVAVTAGTIEVARSLETESQILFDSNAGGTFTAIYGTPTYTYVAAQTQWDNTQYDNAGTLTAMTAGWYSNRYVIRGYLGEVVLMYGRAQYATEAEAIAEATPTDRPEEYMEHGMVIAKITFLKSAASPSTVTDLRPVIGSSAPTALAATSHPNLTNLAWGSSGHTGTAGMLAGFDSAGAAINVPMMRVNGFRLTLESGVPVSTTDQSSKATLYLTPFIHNQISLYDGTTWLNRTSAQMSITLAGLTASTPFDVFVYDNAGTPTLELLAWTNVTTRATALVYQDGALVKTGATTRLYVGSIYIQGGAGGITSDSKGLRYVWNMYNQVERELSANGTTTASYTYSAAAWRNAEASASNVAFFFIGWAGQAISASASAIFSNTTAGIFSGLSIGYDSTAAPSDYATGAWGNATGSAIYNDLTAHITVTPAVGQHYIARLEYGAGAGTTSWWNYSAGIYKQQMVGTIRN